MAKLVKIGNFRTSYMTFSVEHAERLSYDTYLWHNLSEFGEATLHCEPHARICGHSLFGIMPLNVVQHQLYRHDLKMWSHLICICSILSLSPPSVQSAYSEECEVSVRPQSEVVANWNSGVQEEWTGLSDCKLQVFQMNGYDSQNKSHISEIV